LAQKDKTQQLWAEVTHQTAAAAAATTTCSTAFYLGQPA